MEREHRKRRDELRRRGGPQALPATRALQTDEEHREAEPGQHAIDRAARGPGPEDGPAGSSVRAVNHTAGSASPRPAIAAGPGRSPSTSPKTAGSAAASTPESGATTFIRPRASPR